MSAGTLHDTLSWAGDRMNPILVKETRQAFKSRHFSLTFLLSLAAALVVSFGGAALVGPLIDYQATGQGFFIAYFVVLSFAIFLVVPFSAYRSLAIEQEEQTYELLAITSLSPSQIVWGKLFGALAQMLVFYSAISPFLAFTFLLKGIDVVSIILILLMSLFASLGLSLIGILWATISRNRFWQTLLSVVLIVALIFAGICLIMFAFAILEESIGSYTNQWEFWCSVAALITAYVGGFVLIFQLCVVQLTFEADNRSTRIRITVVAHLVSYLGWVGWLWIYMSRNEQEVIMAMTVPAMLYLAVVGFCLVSEPEGLSRRVKRELPRRGTVRSLTTLFVPGPGTGLLFLASLLMTVVVMVGLAEFTADLVVRNPLPGFRKHPVTSFAAAAAAYVLFYVAASGLVVRLLRKFRPVPVVLGALLGIVLTLLVSFSTNCIALLLPYHQNEIYERWQIFDPVMTLWEIATDRSASTFSDLWLVPVTLALAVLMVHLLLFAAREVRAIQTAEESATLNGAPESSQEFLPGTPEVAQI